MRLEWRNAEKPYLVENMLESYLKSLRNRKYCKIPYYMSLVILQSSKMIWAHELTLKDVAPDQWGYKALWGYVECFWVLRTRGPGASLAHNPLQWNITLNRENNAIQNMDFSATSCQIVEHIRHDFPCPISTVTVQCVEKTEHIKLIMGDSPKKCLVDRTNDTSYSWQMSRIRFYIFPIWFFFSMSIAGFLLPPLWEGLPRSI